MSGWWSDISHRLAAKTLIVLALLVALYWNQERGIKHLTDETHSTLCAFKTDLQTRYEAGVEYLAEVKSGKRIVLEGFTVADIQRSLSNQAASLRSLSDLSCE